MSHFARQVGRFMIIALAAIAFCSAATLASAAKAKSDHGTAAQAKALLHRAVAALKANKEEALAKFNSGADGFKDRDLYVFCAGPDWIQTAGPMKGQNIKDLKDKNGKMIAQEQHRVAREGKISKMHYMFPRPGTTEPVEKTSYFTKVGDQICGVGYYK
ncbi:MAG: cache domain-containing protein [Rhodanobacteraceae bacterium]